MCGIAGIVQWTDRSDPPSLDLLREMIGTIRHRGPDEFGVYRDVHAGLVHARLSIIDVTSGHQPMANEDGTLWVTFNGEIFNYVELRDVLEQKGHHFTTRSDTEVIVHAYEEWKEDCFRRFNGQWALALWDNREQRLVLSRDRIGIRPLYIHEHNGTVRFASEVKAIFADPDVHRSFDPLGLDQTFTYWSSLAPTTVFAEIEELLPGSIRVYDRGGRHEDIIYWRPSFPDDRFEKSSGTPRISLSEAMDGLREKLIKATQLRVLRSDVPVGSYLSGGLDSSVIAWIGRQATEGEFRTFSVRFEDSEFDETMYQHLMAARLDSAHEEIVVTRNDIAGVFPEVVRYTERPVLRTAPAPLYFLSKFVRDAGIKCVLTGEGADEMLGGYDLFRESKIREFWAHQPESLLRPKLFERLYPYLARSPQHTKGMALQFWKKNLDTAGTPGFSHIPRWHTTASLKRFFSDEMRESIAGHSVSGPLDQLPQHFNRWSSLAQAQYLEITSLLSPYIISSQGDRMLMAHSVEGRFPFLDPEVMEFCNRLPASYKLMGLDEKHILKKMAEGNIPDAIIRRKKQPYRSPDAISFVEPGAPGYIAQALSEDEIRSAGIFDSAAVNALYRKCTGSAKAAGGPHRSTFSNSDNMALVGILSTQLLYRQYIAGHGSERSGSSIEFATMIDRIPVPI